MRPFLVVVGPPALHLGQSVGSALPEYGEDQVPAQHSCAAHAIRRQATPRTKRSGLSPRLAAVIETPQYGLTILSPNVCGRGYNGGASASLPICKGAAIGRRRCPNHLRHLESGLPGACRLFQTRCNQPVPAGDIGYWKGLAAGRTMSR